ncbi:hypothetical protein CEXT_146491 [Caerostris extrusa]|uniref:Uncharacterized protein n=1 Tax=Caerostris extrusa TaxID=172846 RepID=A0AAV4MHI5_CAEEX|nr:hypothetical protein CEXT_146491 [Caerostris extrusa]
MVLVTVDPVSLVDFTTTHSPDADEKEFDYHITDVQLYEELGSIVAKVISVPECWCQSISDSCIEHLNRKCPFCLDAGEELSQTWLTQFGACEKEKTGRTYPCARQFWFLGGCFRFCFYFFACRIESFFRISVGFHLCGESATC